MLIFAEYLWLDGAQPTQAVRSKTRILPAPQGRELCLADLPEWGFDGSSTNQATGHDSDLILKPVRLVADPLRGAPHVIVMNEVMNADGTPHATNHRARLDSVLAAGAAHTDPWFGIEQEYTLFQNGRPLGWPEVGEPVAQGPFYCGVGADRVHGRDLVEAHASACVKAGLMIYGTNAEVMPGQWEFQIGYRGVAGECADPLTVGDHLWIARWLLQRLGEERGIDVSYDCKPMRGDWNGAGAHTNVSTRSMREAGGIAVIEEAIKRLSTNHAGHIAVYGAGLADRLTGHHETCSIHEFRGGVADRGASIRIPRHVASEGRGYFEDRRPGANCDPYRVACVILETVCGVKAEMQLAASA